jgi:hypothetical protein
MKITHILGAGALAVGSALAYVPTYTPSDMPSVATDILGESGVQLKVYMPLLILGVVISGLAGTFLLIKARLQ